LAAEVSSELQATTADASHAAITQDERGARLEKFMKPPTIFFVKVVMDHSPILGEGKLRRRLCRHRRLSITFGSLY